jgi:hypothetical protein
MLAFKPLHICLKRGMGVNLLPCTMAPIFLLLLCFGMSDGGTCGLCQCYDHLVHCHKPLVNRFPELTIQQKGRIHSVHVLNTSCLTLPSFSELEYPYLKTVVVFNNAYLDCQSLNFNAPYEILTDCGGNVSFSSPEGDPLTMSRQHCSGCNDMAIVTLSILLAMMKLTLAWLFSVLHKYKKMCHEMMKSPPPPPTMSPYQPASAHGNS